MASVLSSVSGPADLRRLGDEDLTRLAAEVREQSQAYAKRPKKKFISSNTREYAYAAYMKGWVGRVERVGNLIYPDEARRRGLHGELVLTVGLNRDGLLTHIHSIAEAMLTPHLVDVLRKLSGLFNTNESLMVAAKGRK